MARPHCPRRYKITWRTGGPVILFRGLFWSLFSANFWVIWYLILDTWNPNDPCWKGPCFGGLKSNNRGQIGSRYIYIYKIYDICYVSLCIHQHVGEENWIFEFQFQRLDRKGPSLKLSLKMIGSKSGISVSRGKKFRCHVSFREGICCCMVYNDIIRHTVYLASLNLSFAQQYIPACLDGAIINME